MRVNHRSASPQPSSTHSPLAAQGSQRVSNALLLGHPETQLHSCQVPTSHTGHVFMVAYSTACKKEQSAEEH